MKHIFLINPFAGKKDSKNYIPVIDEYFKDKDEEYEILVTLRPGHATELASRYHQEDDVCLYCLGGDGTAFEVLNGLNEGVRMAVIPNGTGNDYYRNFSLGKDYSVQELLIKTIEGKNVKVDYGIANNRRFLNASSMGIDADINQEANRIGKKYPIPKSLVYIIAAINLLRHPKPIEFHLEIDGKKMETTSLLAAVMLGKYYGGGFKPTPAADLQDGKFEVCLIDNMPVKRIFKLLPLYMKGEHTEMPEAHMMQAEHVLMDVKEPVLYGCDGEPVLETHIEYRIVRNGLNLRVPKESALHE